MEDVITKNNVKPILTSKEKNRFHQISEQFFKGSHDFFVEQQEKTQKFIDEKLKKSSFYEHYQDAISNVKDNVENKTDEIKNNVKKNFHQKLMNFIILFEIGVIAASQCAFKLEQVSKFSNDVVNELSQWGHILGRGWDGVSYVMSQCGQNFDFKSLIENSISGIKVLMKTALDMFGIAIDYFFNDTSNNAFLICLGMCASKVGESASGAVGIIFDLIMSAVNITVAKRPDLTHFLKYGTNPYMIASEIEMEAHSIVGIHTHIAVISTLFESSGQIGYSYRGQWYGIVNESSDDKDEEEDAKKVLTELTNLRIAASKESAETYASGSYHGGSSILNTSSYQQMVKMWEDQRNELYDTVNDTTGLALDSLSINTKNATVQSIIRQMPRISNFYHTYKESDNPIANKICKEIEKWLSMNLNGKLVILGQKRADELPVRYFVFAPAILYAIIEFEHIQKMTGEMYQVIDARLYQIEVSQLMNKETAAMVELRDASRLFDIVEIDTKYYVDKLNEILKKAQDLKKAQENKFENIRNLRPDILLSSLESFTRTVNLIKNAFNETYNIVDFFNFPKFTYNLKLLGYNTFYAANERGIKQDENYEDTFIWKSPEQMITTISTNHKRKKDEIKRLILQRKALWVLIAQLSTTIQDKVLYTEVSNKITHVS